MNELLFKEVKENNLPKSIGIILDGNGRWAKQRNLPRTDGHLEGIKRIKDLVKVSIELGIESLFLYCFSTENWNRPKQEVDFLMNAFVTYMNQYSKDIIKDNIKVNIIGEKDNLSPNILKTIDNIENSTKNNTGLNLSICFNYGARLELLNSIKNVIVNNDISKENIDKITLDMISEELYSSPVKDIDFIIRTGGEKRLSNFLLWQACYSEFYFTDTYFPDFKEDNYLEAIKDFEKRNRRFGSIK